MTSIFKNLFKRKGPSQEEIAKLLHVEYKFESKDYVEYLVKSGNIGNT